ncbi:hypothetical protein SADUNF_Sadunf01G0184500 [Salix dunnii]|uniref:Uncharacterized protein n=1 Tax=Salix dunnii TaxID=1413687 RepID=A0A835TNE0_9ROSI|nr:hypothetical protein SADUNF_Sadunf01G0184500 [Salix dunnii]
MISTDVSLILIWHESQFIGDIVEEVGKKLDSTALLAPYIDWHRHRMLLKKTKMIVHILSKIGVLMILFGLYLNMKICTPRCWDLERFWYTTPDRRDQESFWCRSPEPWDTCSSVDEMVKDCGIGLPQSAGTVVIVLMRR